MGRHTVHIGGLLRCCVETVFQLPDDGPEPKDGDVLGCKWCRAKMKRSDGSWRWWPEGGEQDKPVRAARAAEEER